MRGSSARRLATRSERRLSRLDGPLAAHAADGLGNGPQPLGADLAATVHAVGGGGPLQTGGGPVVVLPRLFSEPGRLLAPPDRPAPAKVVGALSQPSLDPLDVVLDHVAVCVRTVEAGRLTLLGGRCRAALAGRAEGRLGTGRALVLVGRGRRSTHLARAGGELRDRLGVIGPHG